MNQSDIFPSSSIDLACFDCLRAKTRLRSQFGEKSNAAEFDRFATH